MNRYAAGALTSRSSREEAAKRRGQLMQEWEVSHSVRGRATAKAFSEDETLTHIQPQHRLGAIVSDSAGQRPKGTY